ncbi:MAG: SpoIIE family protein phosphatase [Bacteroidia bacterium]|nr:SpoIIE family protein phosphatase [Bacteroidia bacterium]MDW8158030.1 SpoIIE family protein phosphatase [Bacteroidia bacterium]
MEQFTILCVDDEITILNSIREELKTVLDKKYQIEIAQSGEEGLEVLKDLLNEGNIIPVVISDQLMPGMKGDEFLTHVNHIDPNIKKILLTGQASVESIGNAINKANLYRFLQKPWHTEDLKITIEEAVKSYITNYDLNQRLLIFKQLNELGHIMLNEIEPYEMIRKVFTVINEYWGNLTIKFLIIENRYFTIGFFNEFLQGIPAYRPITDLELLEAHIPMKMFEKIMSFPQPIIEKSPHRNEQWKDDTYLEQKKPKAIACFPLYKNQQISGLLILEHYENTNFFDIHKVDFLKAFIQQFTSALDNALLYKYLEQKVKERTQTIEEQKREILDSIKYARRIQKAILPQAHSLQKWFPQSAILYLPKDIVSGDFYWFAEEEGNLFIAVADCTGHGVPGAFMSVLGINTLNLIVKQRKVLEPSQILGELHQEIVNSLHQEVPEAEIQDGMDIALLQIKPDKKTVIYASANRPILLFRNNEIIEWHPDKLAIGHIRAGEKTRTFHSHLQQLLPKDRLFLFTDGYVDQLGGPQEKRLKKRGLFEYLEETNSVPLAKQIEQLNQKFLNWKGQQPQTDDVLILAIEF